MSDFEFNQIKVKCGSYQVDEDGSVILEGLTNNAIEIYNNNTCKYFSFVKYMEEKVDEYQDEIDDLRDMNTDKRLIEELRDEIDDLEDDIDSLKQEITILNSQLRDKD